MRLLTPFFVVGIMLLLLGVSVSGLSMKPQPKQISAPPVINMNLLSLNDKYFQDDVFDVQDGYVVTWKPYTIQCIFHDDAGLEYIYLDNNMTSPIGVNPLIEINFTELGYHPTAYELNYTITIDDRDSVEGADDGYKVIYENYDWNCYASDIDDVETYYDSDHVSITMDIEPVVYIVHAIDTETGNLHSVEYEQELNLMNYNPGQCAWRAFWEDTEGTENATFRNYTDDFGGNPKITWFVMTTKIYWHNLNGMSEDPIYQVFQGSDTYNDALSYWGDEIAWHFHNHQWYNYTDYENDTEKENSPWLPAEYWNQIIKFDELPLGSGYGESRTPQENVEEVLANRIIIENDFPSTYRSGWIWVDTPFSNWLDGVVKYSYNPLYNAAVEPRQEPIGNVYNWKGMDVEGYWEPYHPSETNYSAKGDLDRWEFMCSSGISQNNIDKAFEQASNWGRAVVCFYHHSYDGPTSIPSRETALKNYIDNAKEDNPQVSFVYATAHEAAKAFDRCEDDTHPVLVVMEDDDYIYIESDEELFADPFLALKNTSGRYMRAVIEINDTLNSTRKWRAPKSQTDILRYSAAASDTCGNTFTYTPEEFFNEPPVLNDVGDREANETDLLVIQLGAYDEDNDTLTYYTNASDIIPSNFSFNSVIGRFVWIPTTNDSGEYNITFGVTDGEFWDYETVTITIHDINPVMCGDMDESGLLDIDDVLLILDIIFKKGKDVEQCVADVDNSGGVDVDDATYLINHIFSGGPAPGPNCCS